MRECFVVIKEGFVIRECFVIKEGISEVSR